MYIKIQKFSILCGPGELLYQHIGVMLFMPKTRTAIARLDDSP